MSLRPGSVGHDAIRVTGSPRWRRPDWFLLLPLGLLVVSVVTLAIYTTTVHRETNAMHQEAAMVTRPALHASQDLTVAIAEELGALDNYTLTGNIADLSAYARSVAIRRAAVAALVPLSPDFHGESALRWQTLSPLLRRWETFTPEPATLAGPGGPAIIEQAEQHLEPLFRAILLDATALQRTLTTDLETHRAAIDAAELRDWYYTLGLVVLALAASAYIVWLLRRVRRLARISERRRLEVEAAMEERARLIRGITHDVKDPLSAADGSAGLLEMGLRGQLTDAQSDLVFRIRRNIRGALDIISDMVSVSSAEAARLEVRTRPTEVAPILQELVDDYRFQADAAKLSVDVDVPPALPVIATDDRRTREILGNLLSNAIKYTPEGGHVTVRAEFRTESDQLGAGRWIALSVIDTGPGIAPEDRERIFEEFYRVHEQADRAAGAGLGLSISRRVARLLGGDLTVDSEVGRGSTFTLWLPLEAGEQRRRAS